MACGPEWLPNWLRDHYFTEECAQHDLDYESSMCRSCADIKFLKAMLAKTDKWYRKGQALFFYIMVRAFGWISYWRSQWRD